ncbi:MAG: helix-turn-helix transcriptional regulator [Christensenellales bacterium]
MTLEEIINRISRLRTRKGLSARELSLRIDKNEAYINRLEYRKNFEPSISVINDIVTVCDSSMEEFFYYDIDEYIRDKQIIELLKHTSNNKKQAIIELLTQ